MPDIDLLHCAQMLKEQNVTIAFAESATAGRVMAEFALTPGSGSFLKGGIVCYDAGIKEDLLWVPPSLIEQYTPESAEVTAAIARGLGRVIPADIHIGITGLVAPGGSETPEKPVGTMFVQGVVKGNTPVFTERRTFSGNPEEIILQTVHLTAGLLSGYLKVAADAW